MPQRSLPNCKNCGVEITSENSVYAKTSRLNTCRECYNKYKRRVNKANYQEHVAQVQEYHKFHRYKMTRAQYDYKLMMQLGGCAICKQPLEKITIDHDHRTNQVRDLLCYRCNNVLGLVNDDEGLLLDMMDYLKRHARRTA